MNRLNHLPTLRVQPEEKISLKFQGKTYQGVAGDSVATALFANGVRVFGRSLKYHRPRGLYSLDGESSNTCVDIDGVPNVRAENTPAKNAMSVGAQNVVGPDPKYDFMCFMDKLSWAMPAGFYYKTMHKPARVWPHAIKMIRKAAGLGVLKPDFELSGSYDEIYPQVDVCVVGGGPAGMHAALTAAEQGLRVLLLENRPWLGGFYEYRAATDTAGKPYFTHARELAQKVEQHEKIRVLTHTAMVGGYNDNLITAFQRGSDSDSFDERYIEIRATAVVAATGCIERPLLFDNNERPGIMQAACAQRLARTYGLLPGKEAVFSIGHDLGLEAAIDLFDLGLKIACVADTREDGQDAGLLTELDKRKIPFFPGWVACKAYGINTVRRVALTTLNGNQRRTIDCDLVVASAGFTPVTGPLNLAHAKMAYDNHTGFFLPRTMPPNMHATGRMLGLMDEKALAASGRLAGLKAAADCGLELAAEIEAASQAVAAKPGPQRGSKFVMAPVKGKKSFICFDEDTTIKNINQAMAMGFDVPELIKRFTAAGTGPGQGGIPGHNLPLYVAQTRKSPDRDPKPTTVRVPLVPIFMGTYRGTCHRMGKRTALHDSQVAAGGRMELVGVWNRARYFSDDKTCREDIQNVRSNVGMLDSSTLGKFRIHGPDALKALQRVYVGNMEKMTLGKIKYSAMCNDDGCVIDDGVVVKLGENDYYFTTSTGRAGATVEWIRFHTRYDGWNFNLVNLTDTYGVINISGPNSRKVLEKITDADVSNDAFPFAGYTEFQIAGSVAVKAMRLGFVGELSYELHVPASYMQAVWDLLVEAGQPFGISNFGLEAQNVLRLEKGHLILGSESEQRTNLLDLGLGFLWYRNKPEAKTIGAVALRQAEGQKNRYTLVGLKMEDPATKPPKDGSVIVDSKIRGYVCTSRYSYGIKEPVAMALVEGELAEIDTPIKIFEDDCNGQLVNAKVVKMPFYDPEGGRMRT